MTKSRYQKGLLFFFILIFTTTLLSNFQLAHAHRDQDTIEPDHAIVLNIVDVPQDWIIDVSYQVISGPSIDAYLCEGVILLLFGPPSNQILFDNDFTGNQWSYPVPSTDDYAVVFINDKNEAVVLQYTVNTRIGNIFGNIPIGFLLLLGGVVGAVIIIVVVVVIVVVVRRSKDKELASIDNGV